MHFVSVIAAIVALIAGICLAACTKKAEGIAYGKLDKAGLVLNILLIPVYCALAIFTIAISIFTAPRYDGFLGVLGMIVCVIIAAAPLFSGLGLGFSVALRKKGKSKQSFAVQFAGIAGFALSLALFIGNFGNLLASLN